MMQKQGVLLINLGTPDQADARSIYRYLTEFLNDPRVIDLPAVARWALVNLLIIPLRYKKVTAAYQKIMTEQGLPLRVYGYALQKALSQALGADYQVALGMRYGQPSIAAALAELRACASIVVIPMFPQYASASTGSALACVMSQLAKQVNIPSVRIINNFYAYPGYIKAVAACAETALADKKPIDHLLLSYHGLPVRQIDKSGCIAQCDRLKACPEVRADNLYCYRAQCYATSRLLAGQLHLADTQYSVAFQSRLGRTPWIKPYADLILPELRKQGINHLAVACPAFVADCLETLEEVNIRMREQWFELGGSDFTFIPCVNDHPLWAQALAELVTS
jgi:ferrochelatase